MSNQKRKMGNLTLPEDFGWLLFCYHLLSFRTFVTDNRQELFIGQKKKMIIKNSCKRRLRYDFTVAKVELTILRKPKKPVENGQV